MSTLDTASAATAGHRAKLAYIYIRQSSLSQVAHHGESTEMQYRLMDRALTLGWPRDRIRILDEDLGKSAATAESRPGFQQLIADVGLGQVGLVLSLDASRLARNCSDWHRLIELCALFGALIADGERLYDPRQYHDRLVLGLSGMMSEAELHQLRIRLQAGELQKAERGELRLPLPAGLQRQRDGSVILNPDDEIQARLQLVFAKYDEPGTARAVMRYLCRHDLHLPTRPRCGPEPHEIVWQEANAQRVLEILHNLRMQAPMSTDARRSTRPGGARGILAVGWRTAHWGNGRYACKVFIQPISAGITIWPIRSGCRVTRIATRNIITAPRVRGRRCCKGSCCAPVVAATWVCVTTDRTAITQPIAARVRDSNPMHRCARKSGRWHWMPKLNGNSCKR